MIVSAQGFFTVLFTFEGLSMWESQTGLPDWRRRRHFRRKWSRRLKESDDSDAMEAALSCAEENKRIRARTRDVRIVKWTPPSMALLCLAFYMGCALFGHSAAAVFSRCEKWFCLAGLILAVVQFLLFVRAALFFETFDEETLVADEGNAPDGFDLAESSQPEPKRKSSTSGKQRK